MADTVFEVSSLLGGQLIVVDVLLLGFGFCIEFTEKEYKPERTPKVSVTEEDNHA